jgi:hypothetical protein
MSDVRRRDFTLLGGGDVAARGGGHFNSGLRLFNERRVA